MRLTSFSSAKKPSEIVDWQHIHDFYESSNPLRQRLTRKLTDVYIHRRPFNSMKVRFATQVLSDTVSLAMLFMISIGALPGTAKFTADFMERVDNPLTASTAPLP